MRSLLGELDESVVSCGQAHMPFDRTVGTLRVVNPRERRDAVRTNRSLLGAARARRSTSPHRI
jgi:hypothetical protein